MTKLHIIALLVVAFAGVVMALALLVMLPK